MRLKGFNCWQKSMKIMEIFNTLIKKQKNLF